MSFHEVSITVIDELSRTLACISNEEPSAMVAGLLRAKRIFLAGAGRSGLMISAFAMRLMHLGLHAYVLGDATTPAVDKDDMLLIASGSGETESLVIKAKKAATIGAMVGLVTIYSESSIGKLATYKITIPAPTPKSSGTQLGSSAQPMGSLFEQSLLLTLDSIVLLLMKEKGTSSDEMFSNHANLE